jgi:hypothetical protein
MQQLLQHQHLLLHRQVGEAVGLLQQNEQPLDVREATLQALPLVVRALRSLSSLTTLWDLPMQMHTTKEGFHRLLHQQQEVRQQQLILLQQQQHLVVLSSLVLVVVVEVGSHVQHQWSNFNKQQEEQEEEEEAIVIVWDLHQSFLYLCHCQQWTQV